MTYRFNKAGVFSTFLGCLSLSCGDHTPAHKESAEHKETKVPDSDQLSFSLENASALAAVDCSTLKISKSKELFITNLSVVNDTRPAWKFKTLISNMIPLDTVQTTVSNVQIDAFLRNWLGKWQTNQQVNGFNAAARTRIQEIINAWPKIPNTQLLDADKAPMRLLSIVYRPDLKGPNKAGEGRFVFGVLDNSGNPLQFTVIFEYNLPIIKGTDGVLRDSAWWAGEWHKLANSALGSGAYKTQLTSITNQFTRRNAFPGKPVGNALSQLRTNEIALSGPWELREFTLAASGLVQATVKQNPDLSFNSKGVAQDHLKAWMVQNKAKLVANTFVIPNSLPVIGTTFTSPRPILGASAPVPSIPFNWLSNATAPVGPTAAEWNTMKTNLSNATCSGCHTINGQFFLHLNPRSAGAEAIKSSFTESDLVPRAKLMAKDLGCSALPNSGVLNLHSGSELESLEVERSFRVH
jgi:hypothetical protein